ncbi:MAG: hypothetical protein U0168_15460 [Nannocystaceae bacterium]
MRRRELLHCTLAALAVPTLASLPGCHREGAGATPPSEIADGQHLTEFQRAALLGHYSSYDGSSGFVLDRTAEPARARVDGDPTVHTLSREPSVAGAYELRSGDGSGGCASTSRPGP